MEGNKEIKSMRRKQDNFVGSEGKNIIRGKRKEGEKDILTRKIYNPVPWVRYRLITPVLRNTLPPAISGFLMVPSNQGKNRKKFGIYPAFYLISGKKSNLLSRN